jgi:hypothetical protein
MSGTFFLASEKKLYDSSMFALFVNAGLVAMTEMEIGSLLFY